MDKREGVDDAAAILVIHGIGSSRPYETLDAFVQGIAQQIGIHERQLEHRLVQTKAGTLSFIRMPLARPTGRAGARTLDFYEFHWAGMVERKIGLRQTLGWLARTALTPLELWAQQAAVILHAKSEEGSKMSLLKLYLGEIIRALLVLIAVVAVLSPFVYVAIHHGILPIAWGRLSAALGARGAGILLFLFAATLLVAAAARGGVTLLRMARDPKDTERSARKKWGIASMVTALALATLAFAIDRWNGWDSLAVFQTAVRTLSPRGILLPLFAAAAAWLLGRTLVDYVGDIALYTTADENSAYYRTRTAILTRSTAILHFLCSEAQYNGVYMAGHSLGSAIAYDTINRLIRDTRAAGPAPETPAADLGRLRGLLTFGSPLDAVYYFFRTNVGAKQPVRAQILSSLHGFRKRSSARTYGDFAFAPYEIPKLPGCRWLNVYSPTDLISRKLIFYEVDEQVRRLYPWDPGRAHLAYWRDKEFYRQVVGWL